MLCYRCQHRVDFLEKGDRPRFECGLIDQSKHACYCYEPIRPLILKPLKGDDRPPFGPWMISARMEVVGVVGKEMRLAVKKVDRGYVCWWKERAGIVDDSST